MSFINIRVYVQAYIIFINLNVSCAFMHLFKLNFLVFGLN